VSVKHQSSTTLICDGCRRIEYFTGMNSKVNVRKVLREEGWHTRPDDRDLCGTCWGEGAR
jgi:hypothetical protein